MKHLLDHHSLTPIINAFSEKLGASGFDIYSLLVVDLLHEFELGVWKSVFTHLIRMLYTLGDHSIAVLDERFRRVPLFSDAIR